MKRSSRQSSEYPPSYTFGRELNELASFPGQPDRAERMVRSLMHEWKRIVEHRDRLICEGEDCGLGHREMAREMGISRQTVARVLAGRG
jgi:hypothetical protein